MSKNKGSFNFNVSVSKEMVMGLFITACEGGSNYWCSELTPRGKGDAYWAMLEGFDLIESEGNKKHRVTISMINEAIKSFATKEPRHFADFLSGNDDAETADAFLQLCVFGKTIYG
jgi:hypothetical protein